MTCHKIQNGFICTSDAVYQYKGITFDWHNYLGPTFLRRKTFSERSWRNVRCRHYGLLEQWIRLSKEEKENTQFRSKQK